MLPFWLQVWRGGMRDSDIDPTFRSTISSAISAKRSLRPSAQRTSLTMLRPSTQLSSRSPCTNTASRGAFVEGVIAPKQLIVRIAGYARAANGPIAAAARQPLICRAVSHNPDKNVVNDVGASAFSLGHVQTRRNVGVLA